MKNSPESTRRSSSGGRYMEIVLRNVAAGVISVDRDGVITTINTSAEKLLNINTGSVMGKNFRDMLRDAHLDIVKESLKELVISKTGDNQPADYPGRARFPACSASAPDHAQGRKR